MTMRWKTDKVGADDVKESLSAAISQANIPSFAKISWNGPELMVRIEQGGTSEIRLKIESDGKGAAVTETKRSIALLHRPFAKTVEAFVERVMSEAGLVRS